MHAQMWQLMLLSYCADSDDATRAGTVLAPRNVWQLSIKWCVLPSQRHFEIDLDAPAEHNSEKGRIFSH
jgi:hypothetical protein